MTRVQEKLRKDSVVDGKETLAQKDQRSTLSTRAVEIMPVNSPAHTVALTGAAVPTTTAAAAVATMPATCNQMIACQQQGMSYIYNNIFT